MRFLSTSQNRIAWLLLSLVIFLPRLVNLDVFLTADEPLFLEHAQEFAQALATGNFRLTLGIGYPGVTVAAWTAPVIALAETEMGRYVLGRVATATLTGLLLLLLFGFSQRLLGRWPALIGVALLALDPYTLGYSRLFHIAGPLALLMTLAGITWLLWLQSERRLWLILGGCFTGLALLTKSTALLLVPMLGAAALAWAGSSGRWRSLRWWGQTAAGSVALLLISGALFFALWPAMWVDPAGTLTLTFGKLFTDQEAGAGNLGLFWFGQFVEDPGPLFYPVAFLLKSTPWLLGGLLLSLYFTVSGQRSAVSGQQSAVSSQQPVVSGQSPISNHPTTQLTHHPTNPPPNHPTVQPTTHPSPNLQSPVSSHSISNLLSPPLWLFALTYLIIMTIASKKSIRYMLPAFPTFYLLTGLALHQIFLKLNHLKHSPRLSTSPTSQPPNHPTTQPPISQSPNLQSPISSFLLLLLALILSLPYHPYYLTYYNPLLLGWRWAPKTLLVGWGEGLDGAARHLNQQPPQTVSAWYEWLFPLLYHNGETQAVVPQENLITADTAVLYINQVQRDIPGPNIIYYFRTRRQPEQTVRLNGIDYVWIYPGPIAGFQPPAAPQVTLGGDFGGEARLLGTDLGPQPTQSGDPLIVTLWWEVLAPPPDDRFVYVRLVDDRGRIWAGTDSPPVMGLWPVERWQPGMFIEDAHALPIPAGTPPGTYRLEVGLYEPDSGQPLMASGRPTGQGGGLLLGEVAVAWQTQREVEPDLPHQTDTALSSQVNLIGYDAPPRQATTGDLLSLRLLWREAGSLFGAGGAAEDAVVFIWSREGSAQAEQIEKLPLPVDQWGRGGVLRSQHDVIVPPALAAGRYNLLLALRAGRQFADEPFLLGTVEVATPPRKFDLPPEAVSPAGLNQLTAPPDHAVLLAGYEQTAAESAIDLRLFWRTNSPLTSRYTVFAQLLDASGTAVAQSDSVPAAGQRPTTGWLPDEIITDAHRLPLPPDLPADQPYRLIAGLYDPITGRRLPLNDNSGDAILIGEITLEGLDE